MDDTPDIIPPDCRAPEFPVCARFDAVMAKYRAEHGNDVPKRKSRAYAKKPEPGYTVEVGRERARW